MPDLPGISVTLVDGYYAISTNQSRYADRLVILARSTASGAAQHIYTPQRYTNLGDVASVHAASSELYEAFYIAQQAGATDIWLCPLPQSGASTSGAAQRYIQLASGYANLDSIEPTLIVPFGRAGAISIDATGAVTRTTNASADYVGAYADSSSPAFLTQLATACSSISSTNRQCLGVIGVKAPSATDAATINAWILGSGTVDSPSGTLNANLPSLTDALARYVSVVVAEMDTGGQAPWAWTNGNTTTYYRSNGALNYAGLISSLDPQNPPTNKMISSASYMPWRFSNNQLQALITDKCVAPKVGLVDGIIRVCDAMTYASTTSDYRRLSTMRIVGAAVETMRGVGESYIGKPMSLWNQNAFKTALTSALETLKSNQAINRYQFSVEFTPVLNSANITLVIEPAWELRLIQTTISVTF